MKIMSYQMNMNSDIIDEIEKYLLKYRPEPSIKLKYLEDSKIQSHQSQCQPHPSNSDDVDIFNKSWCKLSMSEKLNRLMRHHNKLTVSLSMNQSQSDFLRQFFYDNVNTTLASDAVVVYNAQEGEISTINGLKSDINNGFYIESLTIKPKSEGIRIKHNPIINLEQLLKSTPNSILSSSSTSISSDPPPSTHSPPSISSDPPPSTSSDPPPSTSVKKKIIMIKKLKN